jgi:hypothetical protein
MVDPNNSRQRDVYSVDPVTDGETMLADDYTKLNANLSQNVSARRDLMFR